MVGHRRAAPAHRVPGRRAGHHPGRVVLAGGRHGRRVRLGEEPDEGGDGHGEVGVGQRENQQVGAAVDLLVGQRHTGEHRGHRLVPVLGRHLPGADDPQVDAGVDRHRHRPGGGSVGEHQQPGAGRRHRGNPALRRREPEGEVDQLVAGTTVAQQVARLAPGRVVRPLDGTGELVQVGHRIIVPCGSTGSNVATASNSARRAARRRASSTGRAAIATSAAVVSARGMSKPIDVIRVNAMNRARFSASGAPAT